MFTSNSIFEISQLNSLINKTNLECAYIPSEFSANDESEDAWETGRVIKHWRSVLGVLSFRADKKERKNIDVLSVSNILINYGHGNIISSKHDTSQ